MSKIKVPKQSELSTEIEPSNGRKDQTDSSGFGLVNWLFDHIDERKPIFLCLYQEYEKEIKLSSRHRIINVVLLLIAAIADVILFSVYMGAVILIIAGITFIFVKGTGILDFVVSK
ncbi:MAG TPA: hypothetical protein VMR45_01460 [Patescibacteria group bacterium]|nr:hypothetical protein [Patescibacteria group bacterium]